MPEGGHNVQDGVADTKCEWSKRVRGICWGAPFLPASFTTSPRWYHAYLEDTLAIAARLGAPTFFITFTANPTWQAITNELLPGQTASDRPDVVLRVFRGKLVQIRQYLREIFSPSGERYSLRVIDFQHRGK